MTTTCFCSAVSISIISDGAIINPIINIGISKVVIINDFLRARSPNSRAIIS